MSYKINKSYALSANQGASQKTTGKMIVVHSTANLGASAKNNAAFEKRTWSSNGAYVHFIAGDGVVYEVGAPGYVAWGAGGTANALAPVQIEIEETSDKTKFKRIMATTTEFIRDMAKKYNVPLTLDTSGNTGVKTHSWAAKKWHETNHTDPYTYFNRMGYSKAQFAAAIKKGSTSTKKATYLKSAKQVKALTSVARYTDKEFKHEKDRFKKGTYFDISSVVSYGKITRLKLGNGLYITSNTDYVKKIK